MSARRQSYETGHTPKCLVFLDNTPECERALRYASRWAARNAGKVVMLRIVDLGDANQQWHGVADLMRAEAHEDAQVAIDAALERARAIAGIVPEPIVREGKPLAALAGVIEDDPDIAALVLAAGTGTEGPGPIISHLARNASAFVVPVIIVPGGLADADVDALT